MLNGVKNIFGLPHTSSSNSGRTGLDATSHQTAPNMNFARATLSDCAQQHTGQR